MPKKSQCPQDAGLYDTWGRKNRRLPDIRCPECNKVFRPYHSKSKYCSKRCMWKNNGKHQKRPDGSECWWIDGKGHYDGRVWNNGKPIRIRRARWIMEQHIGRPLLKTEVVHHINDIKTDDRIENLKILEHGKHTSHHNKKRKYKNGYKLNLSQEERNRRAERMREVQKTYRNKH